MSEGIANVDVSEIEVTPKMMEVGAAELAAYDPRFDSQEDAARGVFLAMVGAIPKGGSQNR